MSVVVKDGIGYGTRSGAAFMLPGTSKNDPKTFTKPAENSSSAGSSPWADWGSSNDMPVRMAKDIEECGVLNAALDAKSRIAVGKGILPFLVVNVDKEGKEDLEYVNDPEIHDFLEANDSFGNSINSCYDLFGYGWSVSQLLLSRNRQRINRIKRTDVVECRLEKKDKSGVIKRLFIGDDWTQNTNFPSDYIKEVNILSERDELDHLVETNSGFEFAIINRQLRNGRHYYPPPLWYSTKKWVDIAKSLPVMKTAMFNNQITIKYVVTISGNYWKRIHQTWDTYSAKQRQEFIDKKLDEIDKYLAGGENQYKSIFANSYVDPITKQEIPDIKIDVLDDKVKDGKLLPDSAAANSEILFALQVNPALFGAGQPEGAYSNNAGGSNIRESWMIQLMLLEWERRENARIYNIIKKFNKWSDRLETNNKRLVFRYPSGLLTTLDTGKSTKAEVM